MFSVHRAKGFVLKKENIREADQRFWIYTREYGQVVVIAKAIRKLNSKLRSSIDVFCLVEIEFIQGKTQKTLTDAVLQERFTGLKKRLLKIRLAFRFARIFSRLVRNHQPDKNLYSGLYSFFVHLEAEPSFARLAPLFYFYFLLNLLKDLGYEPGLFHCIVCRRDIRGWPFSFSLDEKGLLCSDCLKKKKHRLWPLTVETVKFLRLIFNRNWTMIRLVKTDRELLNNLKNFSREYFRSLNLS